MTNKLPRRTDVDSQILEINNPINLALQLGCIATGLIVIISWLALFGLMAAEISEWQMWPFVVVPIVGWVFLLGWPALWKARRGALNIIDALAKTAEAWLARAGYSVDLNSDGYIGYFQSPQIEPVRTEVRTPAIYSGPGGVKLLAKDAPVVPPVADQPAEEEPAPPPPTRILWDLPGGVRCPVETVRNFVERIFVIGWGRDEWVGKGKPLDRETYDALVNLLCQAQIVEGRKPGASGKLAVDDPQTALKVLNLV